MISENSQPVQQARPTALIFIFMTVLINMIGLGVIMPVMPKLIMEVTGEGLAYATKWGGYLTFVYALMQFIMMPIVGGLSDRFGRRPVLLISLAAYSFDFLMMAIAPTMALIAVARLVAGAFAATFSTANAYIADISPPEKRAANFGLMGAAFGLGFIIGPAIGGLYGRAIRHALTVLLCRRHRRAQLYFWFLRPAGNASARKQKEVRMGARKCVWQFQAICKVSGHVADRRRAFSGADRSLGLSVRLGLLLY